MPNASDNARSPAPYQREVSLPIDARALFARLRAGRPGRPSLLLDGGGANGDGWRSPGLVAVGPRLALACPTQETVAAALTRLEALLEERRARGGTRDTGIALLLAYHGLDPTAAGGAQDEALPVLVALAVDGSARTVSPGRALLTSVGDRGGLDRLEREVAQAAASGPAGSPVAARAVSGPSTSLPRELYLRRVQEVRRAIARGDIYQANLCQRFAVDVTGDAYAFYDRLATGMTAPHAAFLECEGFAVASVSPESFVTVEPDGRIETMPIKGTRPRGASPAADRRLADELRASTKDRAELLMIVDLERNDLGRVCRVGSVQVPELLALRSFTAVHHLVARVSGRLRDGVGATELLRAVFPGGSITGAPKLRAIQLLRELEPVRRNFFTGSLFWFGDDGSVDSSILIRTAVLAGGRALIGAGGGIVTDSDPEEEWRESNHKARALTAALGFDPEEAA